MPPVAPEAAMRAAASSSVVQAIDVPGELTRGRAAHVREPLHWVMTNFPLTHCAKPFPMQAWSPALQAEFSVRVANFAFKACASLPFWSLKFPLEPPEGLVAALFIPLVDGTGVDADEFEELCVVLLSSEQSEESSEVLSGVLAGELLEELLEVPVFESLLFPAVAPEPVRPPFAPEAAMRLSASA